MLTALLLAAALQTQSSGAASPSPSGLAPPPTPGVGAADDKTICRRTANTGSRLGGTKECLTKAQWADRDVQNAQATRDIQARGYQKPGPQ